MLAIESIFACHGSAKDEFPGTVTQFLRPTCVENSLPSPLEPEPPEDTYFLWPTMYYTRVMVVLAILGIPLCAAAKRHNNTIYIIRHGEKSPSQERGRLSRKGKQRAQCLIDVHMMSSVAIVLRLMFLCVDV